MSRGIKIVLMGVDNSGKTTLARNLKETMAEKGYEFSYMPPLGPAPLDKQEEYLDAVLFDEKNVIIDRLPIIEEEVAGRIFRGQNNFDKVNKEKVFGYFQNVDMFIFCNPSLKVITDWGNRPQMNGVKENVAELKSGYANLFAALWAELDGMDVCFHVYDWREDVTGRRFHRIVNSVEGLIKEREAEV